MNLRLLPKLRLLAKCTHDKPLNPELVMECDLIAHSIWRHLSLVLGARPTKRPRRTVLPNNLHPTLEDMWCRLRRPFLKLTRRAREVRPTSCQLPAVPPCHKVKPSITTCQSVELRDVLLLPDRSARPHIPEGTSSFSTLLPLHTLRDGGQTCQIGGHFGR